MKNKCFICDKKKKYLKSLSFCNTKNCRCWQKPGLICSRCLNKRKYFKNFLIYKKNVSKLYMQWMQKE